MEFLGLHQEIFSTPLKATRSYYKREPQGKSGEPPDQSHRCFVFLLAISPNTHRVCGGQVGVYPVDIRSHQKIPESLVNHGGLGNILLKLLGNTLGGNVRLSLI